jgi:hypothetical protein
MQKYINAVSKNKITHFVQANNKRTLCNLNVAKGNWEFLSANSIHPKCECCDKRAENANA